MPLSEPEIYSKLTLLFHDIFDDESIVLNSSMTPDDIEGWDSFKHAALMVQVESAFGIKIRPAEMEANRNVGVLVRQIEAKLSA